MNPNGKLFRDIRVLGSRLGIKQPLLPGQKGRTHKRKPRGQRKVENMSLRQWLNNYNSRRKSL